ncbi:MAG: hypothetical protein OEM59_07285 [Rhodospirillales bacterium]|nr:hypothetical protein [Rhodospirillales bacterium]
MGQIEVSGGVAGVSCDRLGYQPGGDVGPARPLRQDAQQVIAFGVIRLGIQNLKIERLRLGRLSGPLGLGRPFDEVLKMARGAAAAVFPGGRSRRARLDAPGPSHRPIPLTGVFWLVHRSDLWRMAAGNCRRGDDPIPIPRRPSTRERGRPWRRAPGSHGRRKIRITAPETKADSAPQWRNRTPPRFRKKSIELRYPSKIFSPISCNLGMVLMDHEVTENTPIRGLACVFHLRAMLDTYMKLIQFTKVFGPPYGTED